MFSLIVGHGLITFSCSKARVPDGGNQIQPQENQVGRIWNRVDTADETVEGIRLIFKFDEVSDVFIGNIENLTGNKVSNVRVKIRVFDRNDRSTDYGPTASHDLAPGEKLEVEVTTPGFSDFLTFTIHPEIG